MPQGTPLSTVQVAQALERDGWEVTGLSTTEDARLVTEILQSGVESTMTVDGPVFHMQGGRTVFSRRFSHAYLTPFWQLYLCEDPSTMVVLLENPVLRAEDDARRDQLGGEHMTDAALDSMRGILPVG